MDDADDDDDDDGDDGSLGAGREADDVQAAAAAPAAVAVNPAMTYDDLSEVADVAVDSRSPDNIPPCGLCRSDHTSRRAPQRSRRRPSS